ncbi:MULTISPECIES: OsmC family protein [unclassified Knoellia]|uniref:OsmC family protein n=1 Tax=unclassified Knoellia TaxID=2618719 RepID=UPI0023DBBEAC|nr:MULTISPECIES: OsmC family protein [unclassified Knoellia]MDF2092049.1 OsmC family protein [Knoellia sp. 3-2P3]MDF2145606.1 OsmC family protein [Knoellia sp. p5-6-4]
MTDMAEETGGTGTGHRSVTLTRVEKGVFDVTNERGGSMRIGGGGEQFSPVELLLAAIAGCTAIDVDYITTKRVDPETFTVEASGEKQRDDSGNHMGDLRVEFTVTFPEGADGDQARDRLPGAIARSHDRLCTVSRTVERGTPITTREAGAGS